MDCLGVKPEAGERAACVERGQDLLKQGKLFPVWLAQARNAQPDKP